MGGGRGDEVRDRRLKLDEMMMFITSAASLAPVYFSLPHIFPPTSLLARLLNHKGVR